MAIREYANRGGFSIKNASANLCARPTYIVGKFNDYRKPTLIEKDGNNVVSRVH